MFIPLQLPASGNIEAATFNKEEKKLEVSFKSGAKYLYSDIGEDAVQEWLRAPSAGKHFFNYIQSQFPYERVV